MRNIFITRMFGVTFILICLAFCALETFAGGKGAQKTLWTATDETSIPIAERRLSAAQKYLVYRLNPTALNQLLDKAPLELTDAARERTVILEIPDASGKLVRFRLEESPMLAAEIAAQFPNWKTFSGQGIDDPTAVARFDFNANGFHGYVLSASGTYLIDPYSLTDRKNYIVYYKGDLTENREPFACNFGGGKNFGANLSELSAPNVFSNGTQLRN